MNEPGNVAKCGGLIDKRMDRRAGGHIDGRNRHLIAGILENLGRCFGILLMKVSQHDMLADTDAARDGLTDLARPDNNDDILHGNSSG
jgi:hypothetical protein